MEKGEKYYSSNSGGENIFNKNQKNFISSLEIFREHNKINYSNLENIKEKIEIKDYQDQTQNLRENYIKNTIDFPNKNNFENIKKIQIYYNSNYIDILNNLNQGNITLDFKTQITADNVAEFAYPLAQFIEQVRPDYIIACDRGARMISLAVHMMYRRLYGTFPTRDHRINFRKISNKVSYASLRDILRLDVERMLSETESPTVFVIDDWVSSGTTKKIVEQLFSELSEGKINLLYGVMRGKGADVSGNEDSSALCDWRDRPELIGVDYGIDDLRPQKVNSPTAIQYRKKMSKNIQHFVDALQSANNK